MRARYSKCEDRSAGRCPVIGPFVESFPNHLFWTRLSKMEAFSQIVFQSSKRAVTRLLTTRLCLYFGPHTAHDMKHRSLGAYCNRSLLRNSMIKARLSQSSVCAVYLQTIRCLDTFNKRTVPVVWFQIGLFKGPVCWRSDAFT